MVAGFTTHLHGIEEHVTSKLSPQELDTLGKLLRKLLTPADAAAEPKDCGAEEGVAGGGAKGVPGDAAKGVAEGVTGGVAIPAPAVPTG